MNTLEKVFERLDKENLTINLSKSEFGSSTGKYLGHTIGYGKIAPNEVKTHIKEYLIPNNVKGLKRFLGMAGYYRRFCKNFSEKTAPLTDLLKKGRKFYWKDECQEAFKCVKRVLCEQPIIMAPEFKKTFYLAVDASDRGIGAVLMQEDEDRKLRSISYFSKKLNKHQVAYSTIKKETLALVMSVQHFKIYITASLQPTVVHTDHNPLTFLERMRKKKTNAAGILFNIARI